MINIKNAMYTILKAYIASVCTNSGTIEGNTTPTAFPYLLFVQKDNPIYKPSMDSDSKENHVQPMVQIDVFMNQNKMNIAEQVADKADECMQLYGWQRIFGYQPLSVGTDGVCRLTARYQAIIKQNAPNDFTVI